GIPFGFCPPTAPEAAEILERAGPAARLPIVAFRTGTVLANPSWEQLAQALGFSTDPETPMCDLAIVGGGPAGLAAAVYGASEGLATVVVDRTFPGGQAGTSSRIRNYLGFPTGVSGRPHEPGPGASLVLRRTHRPLEARSRPHTRPGRLPGRA